MSLVLENIQKIWGYSFGNADITLYPFFLVDILLVSIIFYYLYLWARNTRIIPIITGLIAMAILFIIARIFDLKALEWILDKILTMLVIAIPIVFSDEIKRFLEKIGQTNIFSQKGKKIDDYNWITEIINFAYKMQKIRCGAIIVIERNTLLTEFIEDASRIDSEVTQDILESIFNTKSPLHDGAVIIRHKRIAAAKSILPISREAFLDLGTRHRAGIGLSAKTDSVVIIISEQTGEVSLSMNGKIQQDIKEVELNNILFQIFQKDNDNKQSFWKNLKEIFYAPKH